MHARLLQQTRAAPQSHVTAQRQCEHAEEHGLAGGQTVAGKSQLKCAHLNLPRFPYLLLCDVLPLSLLVLLYELRGCAYVRLTRQQRTRIDDAEEIRHATQISGLRVARVSQEID